MPERELDFEALKEGNPAKDDITAIMGCLSGMMSQAITIEKAMAAVTTPEFAMGAIHTAMLILRSRCIPAYITDLELSKFLIGTIQNAVDIIDAKKAGG